MIGQTYCFYGDLQAAIRAKSIKPGAVYKSGAVGFVELSGVMTRDGMNDWGDPVGTPTELVRARIEALTEDSDIAAIALLVDSPGGHVVGTYELAETVAAAAKRKFVASHAGDMAASAAYWVGSQAVRAYAAPMSLVGGVGTYSVLLDTSGIANQMGVKVHVVKAGEFKGIGTPGAPVSDAQLAEAQRVIYSLNSHFLAAVAAGRKMTPEAVRNIADGRVHVGQEAQRMGLIDGVMTRDHFFNEMHRLFSSRTSAVSQFDNAVSARMHNGDTKAQAIAAIIKSQPSLHQAYLKEFNQKR